MKEAVIRKRLAELSEALGPSANAQSAESSDKGAYLPQPLAQNPSIEESLDHLRLQATYVLFDLEATKRENRYLRQILEGRRGDNRNSDAG